MDTFEALGKVLSERESPVTVFFRDDDAGWAGQRLASLCNLFIEQELPLDIAAIPMALTADSADKIRILLASGEPWLHIHQHGYAHLNHQREGRSCEFGPDRSLQSQHDDIAQGQELLEAFFDGRVEALFTPPWNRCTTHTTVALASLGFSAFSRIAGSEPLQTAFPSVDVSIDWLKKRKGVQLDAVGINQLACRVFKAGTTPVGVMLHHEHMDKDNRNLLAQFIQVLKSSANVRFLSMLDAGVPSL